MNYQWNWAVFAQISPDSQQPYWLLFLHGVAGTVSISVASWAIAMSLGIAIGIARTVDAAAVRTLAGWYVQFFRGIPLLVQMFLWYFVLPELIDPLKRWAVQTDAATVQFVLAAVCLGLFTSARVSEQIRAGIQSLSRGQRSAATALGIRSLDTYRFILLPQALRVVLPPLTSESMNLIKNSSVAMTIGFAELTFRAREIGETTFAYFEAFSVATLIYVLVALAAYRMMGFLERRDAVPA
ncbi:amino acid ABC transporter permease [Burkholderia sp. MR1-5-21]